MEKFFDNVREALITEDYDTAYEQGRKMPIDDAVAYALSDEDDV